jgi:Predicted acetyltransferase
VTMQHQDNGQKGEFFQLNAEGERLAEMSYLWRDEHTIVANHTWVDDSLRGQGVWLECYWIIWWNSLVINT